MAYRGSDYDDRYYDAPPSSAGRRRPQSTYDDVRIQDRERESDRLAFLRDDPRPQEAGPLVLRQRDVETREVARPRFRSPSPVRHEHMVMTRRARSLTPPHINEERERERIRINERERLREPVPPPAPVRAPMRYVERSPSPVRRRRSSSFDRERERDRIRIIQRERERIPERVPSPSPSPPPPPPPVIRGPTIEREVITHYRDIDHGVTRVPSPPPPPRPAPRPSIRTEERQLDIDIITSRGRTNVDVHRSSSRHREPSQERRSPHIHAHGHELVVSNHRDTLRVEDRHYHTHGGQRRRAHSAAPLRSPVDEEAEFITSKIDSRGRMGEAWNGATKDWTIVDVPPGTERVRMDGVGGGSTDTSWQRYSGVRRTKFIPERDGQMVPAPAPAPLPAAPRDSRERLGGYERELEIEIDRSRDRRGSSRAPPKPKQDQMWTEITRDLVCREALIECGYDFEETEDFFYVMQYLKYDNVLELIQLTETIRRHRKDRARWEHEWREQQRYGKPRSKYLDERVTEREFVYDSSRNAMRRGY
ncbi:hypothetical protein BJF96_g7858 [Verticillium dahliae]|uniref:DUF8035 domain-containing protein n=1 Tax=Verticillium dahliae TaxID=27337 RepID=A0AA44WBV7_VERDA|nr:putative acyltransferase [Verticillium dahliae VDG2]PNH28736.1 hypothetical protein BJF96_g7858 [Verticillium dahliae]PNH55993.1 hypothetical protein VD0003_g1652 [Verticillium dahliae]